jgi:hypothetical protein
MKKSLVIAALGLTVAAVSSFGQGSMTFNSYLANGSAGILTTFSGSLGSGPVGAGYTADLLWSLTPITDVAGNGALTAGWNLSGAGNGSTYNVATPFGTTGTTIGYFQSALNPFQLNPYTAGSTVYFEVIAYQTGLTYGTSLGGRGHSATFSTTLATGNAFPTDIGAAGLQPFTVSAVVPEPTTLALAGLGGLASLVMIRRKKV